MKCEELESLLGDQVEIVKRSEKGFLTISTVGRLVPNSIVFLRNLKFLRKFQALDSIPDNIGIIADSSLWGEENSAEMNKLEQKTSFLGKVRNTTDIYLKLAHIFYHRQTKDLNEMVDGRQMGSCTIHPNVDIAQHVFIGENVEIEEGVTIHTGSVILSNSIIRKNAIIMPKVTVLRNVEIGENCIINSGSTIGSDGFGYEFVAGKHCKVHHFGGVHIENNVEVGANCTIDQGTFSPTIIGEGCKLDDQVHVAHNCVVGKHCLLCGGAALAGSVVLGDYVVMGGLSAVSDNIEIGSGVKMAAGTIVTKNMPAGMTLGGYPARDHRSWLKSLATLSRLSKKS